MRTKLSRKGFAWAVRITYAGKDERPFLAGRYYFRAGALVHAAGNTATFETRDEARAAVNANRSRLARSMTPVRVRITVEEV